MPKNGKLSYKEKCSSTLNKFEILVPFKRFLRRNLSPQANVRKTALENVVGEPVDAEDEEVDSSEVADSWSATTHTRTTATSATATSAVAVEQSSANLGPRPTAQSAVEEFSQRYFR